MGKTITLVKAGPTPRPRVLTEELFGEGDCLITCRACEGEEKVFTDHPALLCAGCLTDLATTARRVANEYASAMVAFFEAGKQLHERAKDNAWYAKTEMSRGGMDLNPALFARAWAAAKASGGEKAALCGLRDAMDLAAEAMRSAELRYLAAAPELEAARAAFGEPVAI